MTMKKCSISGCEKDDRTRAGYHRDCRIKYRNEHKEAA